MEEETGKFPFSNRKKMKSLNNIYIFQCSFFIIFQRNPSIIILIHYFHKLEQNEKELVSEERKEGWKEKKKKKRGMEGRKKKETSPHQATLEVCHIFCQSMKLRSPACYKRSQTFAKAPPDLSIHLCSYHKLET